MSKGVFDRLKLKDFLEPLVVLPFGFWGIYWYEHGFDVVVAILGALLFFVMLPVFIVWWDSK